MTGAKHEKTHRTETRKLDEKKKWESLRLKLQKLFY